jgi:3-oxoacyl-[acyl-carrier protein] reductase
MLDGVIANMVVAVELIQKVIDPMCQRKFGRIVNITSGSVKMPLAGLDLSSGARAGLTRSGASRARWREERHHQQHLARRFRYRPLRGVLSKTAEQKARASPVAADASRQFQPNVLAIR